MSTFAKKTFDATVYAASRPTYPRALYDYVFAYHSSGTPPNVNPERASKRGKPSAPRWERAVDLGCGTGQATTELGRFKHVVGIDPGAGMLAKAKEHVLQALGNDTQSQYSFVQSSAEDLTSLSTGSADMVIAAQACHWFDWSKLWPELSRVMRPGATGAFWGYSEFRLSKYPSLTPLISGYSQGPDPKTSLGPHWERPGRTIVDEHLVAVPDPSSELGFGDMDRIYFTGGHHPSLPRPTTFPVILRSSTTWGGVLGYLRTFSSLHTFHEKYPEDLTREDGDIAERFWKSLMREAGKLDGKTYAPEDSVMLEWPLAVLLIKKL